MFSLFYNEYISVVFKPGCIPESPMVLKKIQMTRPHLWRFIWNSSFLETLSTIVFKWCGGQLNMPWDYLFTHLLRVISLTATAPLTYWDVEISTCSPDSFTRCRNPASQHVYLSSTWVCYRPHTSTFPRLISVLFRKKMGHCFSTPNKTAMHPLIHPSTHSQAVSKMAPNDPCLLLFMSSCNFLSLRVGWPTCLLVTNRWHITSTIKSHKVVTCGLPPHSILAWLCWSKPPCCRGGMLRITSSGSP